ncbi:MAG: endolytic transglycosylase MltG [Myxococcales bacterium]|nr:endolytic transglycosylase MltG [Myxococcales bacterium]
MRLRWFGLWALALVAFCAAAGAWWVNAALGPRDATGESVAFEVTDGASLASVSASLEEAGLADALAFEWLARYRGLGSELKAGEYELTPRESAEQILERLTSGWVRMHTVSIPEGLRATEIAERLERAGLADSVEFLDGVANAAWIRELGLEGDSFEGYLFPETYRLARGLSTRAVLEAFADQFLAHWQMIEPAAREAGLSMREVVILASIVEKETGVPAERPRIASVFLNRLAAGMRLQTDPTVIYGVQDFDGNLTRAHLNDASNPYNTYQIQGLPPGPIANPGADALRSVVEPEASEFLYFVARGDGSHKFSKTYGEHARAVDRFQRGQ